jgi:FAD:protein FMN transferase
MSVLCRTEWRAVGTNCAAAVTAASHDDAVAHAALAAAREEVAACERELSRFDSTSDLSRLNAAHGRWTPVGRRLLEALRLALRAREDTGGRFDPTVLPALAAAGYDRSFELLEERPAASVEGWRAGTAIELDERSGRARLEPGSAVDLGGIGKGYAADRALAALREACPELRGGLVDLGGDIAVHGESPEGGPWLIAVADPRQAGETLAVLALEAGGVATSGRDARRFGPSRSLHHLIDPETGEPAVAGPLTVTVVAPDAAAAEAHATMLAIAGLGEAEAHVATRPALSALYVPQAGPPSRLGSLPLAQPRLLVRAA